MGRKLRRKKEKIKTTETYKGRGKDRKAEERIARSNVDKGRRKENVAQIYSIWGRLWVDGLGTKEEKIVKVKKQRERKEKSKIGDRCLQEEKKGGEGGENSKREA